MKVYVYVIVFISVPLLLSLCPQAAPVDDERLVFEDVTS